MVRYFTILGIVFLAHTSLLAQLDTLTLCEPDSAFLASGDIIDPLPFVNDTIGEGFTVPACIGELYEQLMFVRLPSTINLGLPLGITSVRIDSVTNLPVGMSYVCSRANCDFPADSTGCILLTGTPTADNAPGEYELEIFVTVASTLGPLPINIPNETLVPGTYILTVNDPAITSCIASSRDLDLQPVSFQIFPNPALQQTMLEWESDHQGIGELEVRNSTGQVVRSQSVNYNVGTQQELVDLRDLPSGLYMVGVRGPRLRFWNKVLKL